jgi:hypothetical protein
MSKSGMTTLVCSKKQPKSAEALSVILEVRKSLVDAVKFDVVLLKSYWIATVTQ